jgi:hypothetical protein
MIRIVDQLKLKLERVRSYLELLADPNLVEREFDGIFAVRDERNEVIPGALRYGVSADGPNVAVLGGIHMNEMAGLFALLNFHDRWINGGRPKSGNIYVATGKIERALEFIDLVIDSDTVSPGLWSSFHATKDHFNYNRIPFDILTKKISSDFERRARQVVKYVLGPAKGKVLDLHNTSEDAAPMVTVFMKKGETPEMSLTRLNATGATLDLPIRDFIVWKSGPYNGMESIRSVVEAEGGAIPILIENGGGSNPDSFENADLYLQIWLRNVMGMEPEEDAISKGSIYVDRKHYIETSELYHPGVKPEDYSYLNEKTLEDAKTDTFVLMRDWQIINDIDGWSEKGRQALSRFEGQKLPQNRLDNFTPIKEGAILALGLKTGMEIRSPHDGVVMMVGASPIIEPAYNETFANIGILLQ